MIFEGNMDVRLIQFNWSYVENTYSWIRDPDFRRQFMMRGEPDWGKHIEYFQNVLSDANQRWFAIEVDGVHVGNCGIRFKGEVGLVWIYIGDRRNQGHGIGSNAMGLLIELSFENFPSLTSLTVYVASFNIVALSLYKKVGFKEVPLDDQDIEWTGRDCKVIKMSLAHTRP